MNNTSVQLLLENLLDRIELDAVSGKWRLGTISSKEKLAIELALKAVSGAAESATVSIAQSESDSATETTPVPETKAIAPETQAPEPPPQVALNIRSLEITEPENPEITLCLDFGTAMSKAFAMKGDTPIELALGKRAGARGYPVDSSLFISDDGILFFGPQAVSKGAQTAEAGRVRFDSPKARLSMGGQGDIDRMKVGLDINPTNISISEGEMITLYLGYLTDLAVSELEEQGASRYVIRRFARPCWDDARNVWAEKLLRKMLAQAQILADTFHGRWQDGIPLAEAKAALDGLKELASVPEYLLDHGVPEPVAAAASLMVRDEAQREVFLVIDVGAGTTDFGLFLLQHNPNKDICRVHSIPGTIQYLPQAGDLIDGLLKRFILDQAGIDPNDHQYGRHVAIDLQGLIRQHKETLFRDGILEVALANHTKAVVMLDDFLTSNNVKNFCKQLGDKTAAVLASVDTLPGVWRQLVLDVMDDRGLNVVLTGGGASLPMIKDLANGVLSVLGRNVMRKPSQQVPEWIEEGYPQFSSQYAQLAVAIGGASPDLPDMGQAFNG
jgi:hypothetical protein